MKNIRLTLVALFLVFAAGITGAQENFPASPEKYFGFEPGSDGNLFTYEKLIDYLKVLESKTDRIKLEQIGTSPMGRPMYIAFISAADNLGKLDELQVINRELAMNPKLDPGIRDTYIQEGKVFVLATLSMHSNEVGPAQAAPLIAYDLVTTTDKDKLGWLDEIVFMMVPNHNPDGMDMVVENYLKYKGTKYDGSTLPDVYHKYVGHDNNRDFVILSQDDTKAIAAIYNKTWYPQVMVEKHQMGATGVRFFVPPNHDPIAENVPGSLFSWSGLFGQHMATDMTNAGLEGVAQHYLFDDYWPGSTETCIWKNVIGFLTEAASARTASPVYIEPGELQVGGKGLSEYKKSTNMLLPWEGGWWRLGDIVQYEIVSTMSVLRTSAVYRKDILEFRNRICREMVETGKTEPPYYYILPKKQADQGELVNLVDLMQEHGVDMYQMDKDMLVEQISFSKGDVVIPLAQPFRAFIKEVMEKQEFPERHYTPGGELIEPYDITSWSLPLHRNIQSYEINSRTSEVENSISMIGDDYSLAVPIPENARKVILPVTSNESYRAAFAAIEKGIPVLRLSKDIEDDEIEAATGSFVLTLEGKQGKVARELVESLRFEVIPVSRDIKMTTSSVKLPKIALVETYFHDMDAGWTRFIFDTYHIPYKKVRPHELATLSLSDDFDVIIFPDVNKDLLMEGKFKSGNSYYQGNYPPEYIKGIGKEGMKALVAYVEDGGIVLSWGRSANLFEETLTLEQGKEKEEFQLPFKDVSTDLAKLGLNVPGSLLKVELVDGPLTLGMPGETSVFSRARPVFQTSLPGFDMDRRVIGYYPEKEVLVSGYAGKEELLGRKAAMIWMQKGKGQLVLYGFNPQFRASTQGTFKLLFNALLLEKKD